ncbi:hypothetical protein C8R46DRAFT_1208935 [Mycena filopes]|nr:hypothetical protein C8R46DRAFT_1208935 [Mycena filopes]
MVQWMLVSHNWLAIVHSIAFRDVWITSNWHSDYIRHIWSTNASYICGLRFTLGLGSIATITSRIFPQITTLHFVLIDCNPTFGAWSTSSGTRKFPLSLTDLHVTFAYTSPPPTSIHNARRGTFFPPPSLQFDLLYEFRFDTVRRLVVRDANADFVAFLTTAYNVPDDVKNRLVFVRLLRTTNQWPGVTAADTKRPPRTFDELRARSPRWDPNSPPVPKSPAQIRRKSVWHLVANAFGRGQ